MNSNRLFVSTILLLIGFILQGCNGDAQVSSDQEIEIREVNVDEARRLLSENAEIQLVDVRTDGEVSQGYISGARHIDFMNWDEFTAGVDKLDKTKPVMVYCKVGGRSHKAAVYLSENGFAEIYDMRGGIMAWNEGGKPLIKE